MAYYQHCVHAKISVSVCVSSLFRVNCIVFMTNYPYIRHITCACLSLSHTPVCLSVCLSLCLSLFFVTIKRYLCVFMPPAVTPYCQVNTDISSIFHVYS